MRDLTGAAYFIGHRRRGYAGFGEFFETCKKLNSQARRKFRAFARFQSAKKAGLKNAKAVKLKSEQSAKSDWKKYLLTLLMLVLALWFLALLGRSIGELGEAMRPAINCACQMVRKSGELRQFAAGRIAALRSALSVIGLRQGPAEAPLQDLRELRAIPEICRDFEKSHFARHCEYSGHRLARGANWADFAPHFDGEKGGDVQIEIDGFSELEALANSSLRFAGDARANLASDRVACDGFSPLIPPRHLRAASPSCRLRNASSCTTTGTSRCDLDISLEPISPILADPCGGLSSARDFRFAASVAHCDSALARNGNFQIATRLAAGEHALITLVCGGGGSEFLPMARTGAGGLQGNLKIDACKMRQIAGDARAKSEMCGEVLPRHGAHQVRICIAVLQKKATNVTNGNRGRIGRILNVEKRRQNSAMGKFFGPTLNALSNLKAALRGANRTRIRAQRPRQSRESDDLKCRIALLKSALTAAIKLQHFWAEKAIEIRFAISALERACEAVKWAENRRLTMST